MTLETLSEVQHRLSEAGFHGDLVAEGVVLRDVGTGDVYEPAELSAVEVSRFEGDDSDPGDEAILVAVGTRGGRPVGTFTVPYGPAASADEAEILQHLHPVVISKEDAAAHDTHDHIVAIFANRDQAEAAVAALREVGMGSEHLAAAIHQADSAVFEHDEERDMGIEVAAGVGTGTVVGSIGGMLLFGLAGAGTMGIGGIAAIGAATGLAGAMFGGYRGVAVTSDEFEEHDHLRSLKLQPGEVLVAACSHGNAMLVANTFQRHGGRIHVDE